MNEAMTENIHGTSSLRLYSIDDDGYAFLKGVFDTGYSGCSASYIEIIAEKQHPPPLHFTRTERDSCRDVVGSSDEEEEEDEVSDSSKGQDDSGQADIEVTARTDIADIMGRYNVVWKTKTGMDSEEVSWLDHTVMISPTSPEEVEQQDPQSGPGRAPTL